MLFVIFHLLLSHIAFDSLTPVITVTIRTGKHLQSLTLRTNTIANPISTPFNQVLSWLCQRRDYHTAASVALSLLDDAEAVYELCGIPWNSFEDKLTYHKGLLDGITSLDDILAHKNDPSNTLPSLSDMAIGCMIKGGTPMSITLEGFLARKLSFHWKHYHFLNVSSFVLTFFVTSCNPLRQ